MPSLAAVVCIKLALRSSAHSGTLVRADRHPRPWENRHDRHPRRRVKVQAGIAARCRITAARNSASMCPITLTINSQKLGRSNEQTRWEFAINLLKRRPRPPPCCRGWRPLPSYDDPQWLYLSALNSYHRCLRPSVCPFMRMTKLVRATTIREILFIYLLTWLEYSMGKIFRQVRTWVSRLVKYVHDWPESYSWSQLWS